MVIIEWLTYYPARDERTKKVGLCSRRCCNATAAVVRYTDFDDGRSSQVFIVCEKHARREGWSGVSLFLSEGEISLLCQMSGNPSAYYEGYENVSTGSTVTFWTEPSEEYPHLSPLRAFRMEITAMKEATHSTSSEQPYVRPRLFEGRLVRSTDPDIEPGDKACGIIFPEGFASVFPHDPIGDYANRAIWAMMVHSGHDVS